MCNLHLYIGQHNIQPVALEWRHNSLTVSLDVSGLHFIVCLLYCFNSCPDLCTSIGLVVISFATLLVVALRLLLQ